MTAPQPLTLYPAHERVGQVKPLYAPSYDVLLRLNVQDHQERGLTLREIAAVRDVPLERVHRVITEWLGRPEFLTREKSL